ncbi:hypothetical protein RHS01_07060 [Rhizoctonia solani]|uniref:Glycosyltransferase 2-like domain-containing protein n=1 Tax=Rhizoctonia solani TaxID=456999 RepID=A0A8H7M5M7_9AGAM|nr:hypothetical protein RHS01_07060 [Rhizoctonia solani]
MADVTAIVLNWARLENVKSIVAHLCDEPLRDTISNVIVWNNSPDRIDASEFVADERVRIINSDENLFFQARFLACLEAEGEWCLVQDDDYLVSTESIKALRKYAGLYNTKYPSTFFRRTNTFRPHSEYSYTLLCMLPRSHGSAMVLSSLNRMLEQGREVAFTVGAEGDARNWYYTAIAEKYLESIVQRAEPNGYTDLEPKEEEELVTRSPASTHGLWSTNVPMLPRNVFEAGRNATDLRSADMTRRSALGEVDARHYIHHSFACVGDGLEHTVFKSPAGCEEGQWLSFDLLEKVEASRIEIEWTIEPEFAHEVQDMNYQISEGGEWINAVVQECTRVESESPEWIKVSTRLDLESPRILNIVRANIGPGSGSERPAWGVAGCAVRVVPE